jgi:ParB family transcriptional regulator, chromosome partitioning protein
VNPADFATADRKTRWREERPWGHGDGVDVDLHLLELRHDDLRVRDEARRRRLIASVAEIGQQVPVIVIEEDDHLVLIDGYLRVEALRRLGRDQVAVTTWPVTEAEALVHHHHLGSGRRSAFEDGWLLKRLRWHGLSLDELARRLCRSTSWVSRRLALVDELVPAAQAAVRSGTIPAQAAMKHLVPLSRANQRQCTQLVMGLAGTRVSVREVGALYTAWRRADSAGREQLTGDPLLLLRALREATDAVLADETAPLLKDLNALAVIAWRARRRVPLGGAWTAEHTQAWCAATDAIGSLRTAIEEVHAGSEHSIGHSGVA